MSTRAKLDILDLAIVAFREAIDEITELVDKLDSFTQVFEQLLEKEATIGDDR